MRIGQTGQCERDSVGPRVLSPQCAAPLSGTELYSSLFIRQANSFTVLIHSLALIALFVASLFPKKKSDEHSRAFSS